MLGLFYRAMHAIEMALTATREYATKDGEIYQGGPDHYARMTAAKQLLSFLTAGRSTPKHVEPRRGFTLEEIHSAVTRS